MAGWRSRIAARVGIGFAVAAAAFRATAPAAAANRLFANSAAVGGRVWLDVNGDGHQGGLEEPGLAGIWVALRDEAGAELAATTTGEDGAYQFDGLEPGAYVIQVGLPAGALATIRDPDSTDPASDPNDSDIGPDGMTPSFKLVAGERLQNIAAGLLRTPVLTARMDAYPQPEKPVYNRSVLEYRIWVTNTAETAALDVAVTNVIPDATHFLVVTGGAGVLVKPELLMWQFQSMQPGIGYQVSFRLEDVG